MSFWRDHSLTIVIWGLSLTFLSVAFVFEPGRVFDLLLGIGIGTFTVALLNTLAGPLRERNKPEKTQKNGGGSEARNRMA
jgi:hypothetical protein